MRLAFEFARHFLALDDDRVHRTHQAAPGRNDERAEKRLFPSCVDCAQQIVTVECHDHGYFPFRAPTIPANP